MTLLAEAMTSFRQHECAADRTLVTA